MQFYQCKIDKTANSPKLFKGNLIALCETDLSEITLNSTDKLLHKMVWDLNKNQILFQMYNKLN